MYRRDFGILILALFAIYWSLQNEGTYKYHEAFYYKLPPDEQLGQAAHPLPSPVVVRARSMTGIPHHPHLLH
jgi:hypothetical protein